MSYAQPTTEQIEESMASEPWRLFHTLRLLNARKPRNYAAFLLYIYFIFIAPIWLATMK